jgi:hypothetical protein
MFSRLPVGAQEAFSGMDQSTTLSVAKLFFAIADRTLVCRAIA